VDGGTHGEDHEVAADAKRTHSLERMGYRICRAFNGDIYENMDGVFEELLALLEGRASWGKD